MVSYIRDRVSLAEVVTYVLTDWCRNSISSVAYCQSSMDSTYSQHAASAKLGYLLKQRQSDLRDVGH
jgi:hypothetical protein